MTQSGPACNLFLPSAPSSVHWLEPLLFTHQWRACHKARFSSPAVLLITLLRTSPHPTQPAPQPTDFAGGADTAAELKPPLCSDFVGIEGPWGRTATTKSFSKTSHTDLIRPRRRSATGRHRPRGSPELHPPSPISGHPALTLLPVSTSTSSSRVPPSFPPLNRSPRPSNRRRAGEPDLLSAMKHDREALRAFAARPLQRNL